jgi:lysophospholipase L1-like esterase
MSRAQAFTTATPHCLAGNAVAICLAMPPMPRYCAYPSIRAASALALGLLALSRNATADTAASASSATTTGTTAAEPSQAAGQTPGSTTPAVASFDNPCISKSGGGCKTYALDAFVASANAQRDANPAAPLRLSYIGDSLTADDQIVDRLRSKLQREFGNGGPGFVFAIPPHPFCQLRSASRSVAGTWASRGVIGAAEADHLMGLGGSSATGSDGARLFIKSATPFATAEVFYMAQPHGGTLDLVVDKSVVKPVSTKAEQKSAGFDQATFATPTKQLEVRVNGDVRMFGVALENGRGAVVDNLGVVNGTAKTLLRNNQAHWTAQLQHRAPALTIIMLGTNEAEWLPASGPALDEHEKLYGKLLDAVRAANPNRSCLVIPPFDQLDWRKPNTPPRPSVPAMVTVQHRVATAHGCAFWNTYEWMGGAGSSRGWAKRRLVTNDFQHPTTKGANLIGDALAAGLLALTKR